MSDVKTSLARSKKALLDGAYAGLKDTVALDPTIGAQHGLSPKLGNITEDGEYFSEWVSNQKQISQPVIAFLIQSPRGFDYMPNPEKWHGTLKILVEEDSKSIEGLAGKLTTENSESAVGKGGEMMTQPSNVTRERSNPVHTTEEREGKPYTLFLDYWIRYLMQDPETKKALIATLDTWEGDTLTPEYYAAAVLYVQPDVTMQHVREAWLCVNWYPTEGADIVGRMDATAGGELTDITLNTTPITIRSQNVRILAKSFLERMNTTFVDPDTLPLMFDNTADGALDASLKS